MILDEEVECPRCGRKTKLVDEVKIGARTVLQLCTHCSDQEIPLPRGAEEEQQPRRPLKTLLLEFRRLVHGIVAATERHCAECGGAGWRYLGGGKGVRLRRCGWCAGTGVDMDALLAALEIDEKPRPSAYKAQSGHFPGEPAGIKRKA